MSLKYSCQIKELSFGFEKGKNIIENASLDIIKGAITLITGRNGSGKSVLLRLIKGLLQPSSGSIIIDDKDLSRHPNKRNKKVALVFQDADIQIVGQTVKRDLLFGLENLNVPLEEQQKRINHFVDLLNLEELLDKRPRSLSGGEKRRLAIASSLVMHPQILMLDEPFANLDYEGIKQVLKSLLLLEEQGTTIIVATHEIEKVAAHSLMTIILDDKKVVVQEATEIALDKVEKYGIRRPMANGLPIAKGELTWLK